MNNSYRIMLNRFHKKYPNIENLYDIGTTLHQDLEEQVGRQRIHGQGDCNELIALAIQTQYTEVPYTGMSVHARENKLHHKGPWREPGYSGKIFFRTRLGLYPDNSNGLLEGPFHFGTGGYSTVGSPWYGRALEIVEAQKGMAYEHCKRIESWVYDFQFYISDFPAVDELMLMEKMGDRHMPPNYTYFWEAPGVLKSDEDWIDLLTK